MGTNEKRDVGSRLDGGSRRNMVWDGRGNWRFFKQHVDCDLDTDNTRWKSCILIKERPNLMVELHY